MLLCELCDRSGRSAWPEVASGLTPDSIQKKYAQTVVSAWIALVACSFWWRKNVFTRPGPAADLGYSVNNLRPGTRKVLPNAELSRYNPIPKCGIQT